MTSATKTTRQRARCLSEARPTETPSLEGLKVRKFGSSKVRKQLEAFDDGDVGLPATLTHCLESVAAASAL